MRRLLLLFVLGLTVSIAVAVFQPNSGYMDADYYLVGGLQLAGGQGFSEPILWNYLDNPTGLPHPSHTYWMPLASLLAAAGVSLLGSSSWWAARSGFLLVAALIPPLTACLSWSITKQKELAFQSGLLAVFPAFYLPFFPVTDTFGLYMLFGGLFFLIFTRLNSKWTPFLLGNLAGFMHLTRADGLTWLFLALVATFLFWKSHSHRGNLFLAVLFVFGGYLLVMGPWYFRNLLTMGTLLAPGGSKMLWLTSYDQIFTYPASQINFSSWWQSGITAILRVRLWALGWNLSNMLSVQGEVFLLPLIGIGLWHLRREKTVVLAALAGLVTLLSMTVIFPFAGARGSYFHSSAAMQTMWWVLAPAGLNVLIEWGSRKRGWNAKQAGKVFQSAILLMAVAVTAGVAISRLVGKGEGLIWGQEQIAYSHTGKWLTANGMDSDAIVMVVNPPGFHLATGHPAIAVPDGDLATLLEVAEKYEAQYLVLDAGSTPQGLTPVFDDPSAQPGLKYLGEMEGIQTYAIAP